MQRRARVGRASRQCWRAAGSETISEGSKSCLRGRRGTRAARTRRRRRVRAEGARAGSMRKAPESARSPENARGCRATACAAKSPPIDLPRMKRGTLTSIPCWACTAVQRATASATSSSNVSTCSGVPSERPHPRMSDANTATPSRASARASASYTPEWSTVPWRMERVALTGPDGTHARWKSQSSLSSEGQNSPRCPAGTGGGGPPSAGRGYLMFCAPEEEGCVSPSHALGPGRLREGIGCVLDPVEASLHPALVVLVLVAADTS